MKREKELIRNTTILTIGKVCTQMITFFLLPLYTSVLSLSEYGIVDLLNTLVTLAVPIITLQVEQALFRKLIDVRDLNDKQLKNKNITTAFYSVTLQLLLVSFIISICSIFVNNSYIYFLMINIIVYVYSSLFQQIARGLGKNIDYSIGSFIGASSTIVLNVLLLVVFKLGIYGMLIGTFIGQLMCVIYLLLKLKIYSYIRINFFDFTVLKKLLIYSLPLIPNSISWWIFNASDRVIVSSILGVDQNGYLSVAHKFSTIIVFLLNIYAMSLTETTSLHVKENDFHTFYNRLFKQSIKVFSSIAIIIIAAMPFIFNIFVNNNFYAAYYQIPILMVSSIPMVIVSVIGTLYIANNNTKTVATTSFVAAILNIVVNICLIKYIGLYAATLSTLLAYLIMSIYRIHDSSNKYFKIDINPISVTMFIIILCVILIAYYNSSIVLKLLSLFAATIYIIVINKDILKTSFSYIRNKNFYQRNAKN